MSDDEDERMDRAKRIRELREGRRVTDSETDASADGTDRTDEATEPDATETASSDDPNPDDTADDGTETTRGQEESTENATADAEADDVADAESEEADTAATGDDTIDSEATAAVQAAAQAAQEFEGEGGVAMEPETESASEDDDETGSPGESARDTDTETTRVLEFRLGDELYCLDIAYVEEIVHEETVTRVPNTPAYVSGVVDLRGQITTILDPKVPAGLESDVSSDEQLIVVFDAEQFDEHGNIGWLVDEVNQVTPISEDEVKDSPIDESYINGILERDDEFVIWTTPELALDLEEE